MGKDCCGAKASALVQLRARQAKVLKIVLVINAAMFFVELISGWLAQSTALLADSLDMFGDAFVYAFSLYVLNRSQLWRARAALVKGGIMLGFGALVFGEAIYKLLNPATPDAHAIGAIGILALAANLTCLLLLMKHKSDDINMKSTWICSRNDIIANTGVILAAVAVGWTQTQWPDILVGLAIAALFAKSATHVVGDALREMKEPEVRAA